MSIHVESGRPEPAWSPLGHRLELRSDLVNLLITEADGVITIEADSRVDGCELDAVLEGGGDASGPSINLTITPMEER